MALLSVVLIAAVLLCLVVYLARRVQRKPRAGEPPLVPGHFLWGNGKEFGENAVQFLHGAAAKLGGLFTVRLLHYHMTIVADPHSFENFSREKNFDFDAVQEQVNSHIFGFSIPDSRNMIKFATKTTKGPAVPRSLCQFQRNLDVSFDSLRDSLPRVTAGQTEWSEAGLLGLASDTIFRAIFNSIFGPEQESPSFNYRVFGDNLRTFHKYFNYVWIGLPKWLFPEACRALRVLSQQPSGETLLASPDASDYIKAAIEHMHGHGLDESAVKGHNLVYLHVNMNTFKIAFWCVHNLLRDPVAMAAVRAELDEMLASRSECGGDGGPPQAASISTADIDSLRTLDSVVNESFRLASGVFMVRVNKADTQFTVASTGHTYTVRAGDKVCMHPPAIHKDPEIFENPTAFKYDRFIDQKFYKNGIELKNPVLAFGTLCPGKRIAVLQVKFFLISLLSRLDIEALPGQQATVDVRYHGHEILPPTNDVQIRYRFKEAATDVSVTGC